MALPKWTDERTDTLTSMVGDESPVSQDTVAEVADRMETSARSVSSKLRKMGYEVELASERAAKKSFSTDQEATLKTFLESNSGEFTYAQIAENFESGTFSAKQLQGKILSMELTGHVKPAPKVESQKSYSDSEEATFVSLQQAGKFLEEIADALNRPLQSVRGKALSLLRSGHIDAIPRQRDTKGSAKVDLLADIDVTNMTVEEIAEAISRTPRGVKTMLTRRAISAVDYDGAAKAAKAAE